NEIDGPTLELMNSVEKITTFIPKFKQQLLFLNEREKLFNESNDNLTQPIVSSSASSNLNLSSSSSFSESISDCGSKEFISNATSESDQSLIVQEKNALFPDKYVMPPLPNTLRKDIQNGALNKFDPHYSNRQILIEAVANDLIDKYNMFYPTHKQFKVIDEAIVECLKLPLIQENITIQRGWAAIQNQVLTKNELITTTCNIIEDILFDSCQTVNSIIGNIVNEIRIRSSTEEQQKTFLTIEEHFKLVTTKVIDKKQAY
ncbi:unnamed protein product, partial [Rotaria magnacalcarata]